MNKPEVYNTRTVQRTAIQWTSDNQHAVWDWIGSAAFFGPIPAEDDRPATPARLWVAANEAWLDLEPGEWIIKDSHGYYPCKNDVFHEKYDTPSEVSNER